MSSAMGDGFGRLLILSGIMGLSSFVAGLLPLSFSLSARQLRIITTIGAGLLVGTAFVIIIPEGVETIYSSNHAEEQKSGNDNHADPHSVVGLSLVIGFVLMYLIDSLPLLLPRSRKMHDSPIPLASSNPISPAAAPSSSSSHLPPTSSPSASHATTTIGLVIHSFADGIALGASTAAPTSPSLVVFAAILLHKAPAAFGLSAALLKRGLGKRPARAHVLLFSLAAPLGAVATWFAIAALAARRNVDVGPSPEGSAFWTGVALTFSGGTFL
jgi:zinc transporter 9